MHKQSFAECHSLATKEVSKKNSWSFQLKPQEFKQKTPGISIVNPWGLFSYNPDYTINAATSAKIA